MNTTIKTLTALESLWGTYGGFGGEALFEKNKKKEEKIMVCIQSSKEEYDEELRDFQKEYGKDMPPFF